METTTSFAAFTSYTSKIIPNMEATATSLEDFTSYTSMILSNEQEDAIAEKMRIQNVFGPIMFTVVVLGLLGNMTSIVVMSTKAFRSLAISRPIRCLAISDSLYLICIINNQVWFRNLIGYDIRSASDVSCKLINWLTRSTAIFSAWMVVLLAMERFFAIWFFEVTKRVFSVKKMTISIIIIVVLTATFNAVWTYHSDAVFNGVCIANVRGDLITKNFLVACVFLYVGIPAPTLLMLNILIIGKLYSHSKRTKTIGSVKIPHHRITAMLLAVTTVFVLFVPPIALSHMVAQLLGQNLFATMDKVLFIAGQVAQLAFELNCAINFYLYVLMGSTFRNMLKTLLCRCTGMGRGAPYTFSTSSKPKKPESGQNKQQPDIANTDAKEPEQNGASQFESGHI